MQVRLLRSSKSSASKLSFEDLIPKLELGNETTHEPLRTMVLH
jgi:hypothetical protein